MKNDRITIILFALLLVLPFPSYFLCRNMLDSGNYENRTLAEFPSLTAETITEFPTGFDEYLNDHLPFKNQMTGLNTLMDIKLFNRSSSGKVVFGTDGWLFYSDVTDGNCVATYKGIDLFTDEELELIAQRLVTAQTALAQNGTQFYLFIAPDKQQIYPEYMPDYITVVGNVRRTEQLVSYLEQNTDIKVLYIKDQLIEKKEQAPLFYQLDTHWNDFGAYIGAKEMLKFIGYPDLLSDYTAILQQEKYYSGDLANAAMTGKNYCENNKVLLKGDFGEYTCNELNYIGVSRYTSNEEHCAPIKLMVERDSFSDSMIQFVAPLFEKTVYQHRIDFDPRVVWQECPDIFVYQVVERYIYQIKDFTLEP